MQGTVTDRTIAPAAAATSTLLCERRKVCFVLWRPGDPTPANAVLAKLTSADPIALDPDRRVDLGPSPLGSDVCEWFPAGLTPGVYCYWFEVTNTNVYGGAGARVLVADPCATMLDWRIMREGVPASLVKWDGATLRPCDSNGALPEFTDDPHPDTLAPNNRLVIYELPVAWSSAENRPTLASVAVGTFRDVRRLVDGSPGGEWSPPPRHLIALGANVLELLPCADSAQDRSKWGYGTANPFAPDFDYGQDPSTPNGPSTSLSDFAALVQACHKAGLRMFYDAVMAFAQQGAYSKVNFPDVHIKWTKPGEQNPDPEQSDRNGFGGDLFRYEQPQRGPLSGYDPTTGTRADPLCPAEAYQCAHIDHWIGNLHIDGVRLDSITNVRCKRFLDDFRNQARKSWRSRYRTGGHADAGASERFLVVGESLPEKMEYLTCLDALWHEEWKQILRNVIVGRNWPDEPSFEWSVRKLIDPRCLSPDITDLAQSVIYIGSHDVGDSGNERFHKYLDYCGVKDDEGKRRRFELAFACLLTSVGIPMILAGDEFADEQDIDFQDATNPNDLKQTDPVDYGRLATTPWRQELFGRVARLVRFRTLAPALSVNDTNFIHADFTDGKRLLAWHRGGSGDEPVVVVANFSDWGSANPTDPNTEYRVPNWPGLAAGQDWYEVIRDRIVPAAWVGREPIYPWDAKVYTRKKPWA